MRGPKKYNNGSMFTRPISWDMEPHGAPRIVVVHIYIYTDAYLINSNYINVDININTDICIFKLYIYAHINMQIYVYSQKYI